MADKYVNAVGVQTIKTWVEGKFALDADLDALSERVEEIISEGGEPNVIETVKVNGTALTPDAQKAVDVEAAQISGATVGTNTEVSIQQGAGKQITFVTSERYSEGNLALVLRATSDGAAFDIVLPSEDEVLAMIPISTSQLENDGDGESPFATEAYVDENGGKIDKIKKNGTELPIAAADKSVDIEVPEIEVRWVEGAPTYTKAVKMQVGDTSSVDGTYTSFLFTDASGNQWAAEFLDSEAVEYIAEQVAASKISSVYKPKGSITFANLPALAAVNEGNIYDISDSFTTTADFVEGAGKTYPAGTNVAIINTGTEQNPVYKYDVMPGFIDLSSYWTSETGKDNTLEAMTVSEINAILNPTP